MANRWIATCCAVAALLVSPALASAQSAIVLLPEGPSEALERARAGAIEVLAERGIRLVRTPDGEPCAAEECARAMARTSGVDYVLIVDLPGEGRSMRARVRVVRAEGEPRSTMVDVGDAGVGAAASAAVERALSEEHDRRLGFLLVRTEPPGASIEIDGERAGESPLRRMVAPGEHRVRIVPERGEARERSVRVRAVTEAVLDVDLTVAERARQAPARHTRTEASPFNWLIGGALAIGGVVALISPLETLAKEGECVDLIEDVGCVERVSFGARSGVLLAVGLAALIGAVVIDVVAPIQVEVAVGPEHALVRAQVRF